MRERHHHHFRFDMSEDFFTPAVRARVVSFILKRKWFVRQTSAHEVKMDFGIDKLLADGTYMASYAPHEVSRRARRLSTVEHQSGLRDRCQSFQFPHITHCH